MSQTMWNIIILFIVAFVVLGIVGVAEASYLKAGWNKIADRLFIWKQSPPKPVTPGTQPPQTTSPDLFNEALRYENKVKDPVLTLDQLQKIVAANGIPNQRLSTTKDTCLLGFNLDGRYLYTVYENRQLYVLTLDKGRSDTFFYRYDDVFGLPGGDDIRIDQYSAPTALTLKSSWWSRTTLNMDNLPKCPADALAACKALQDAVQKNCQLSQPANCIDSLQMDEFNKALRDARKSNSISIILTGDELRLLMDRLEYKQTLDYGTGKAMLFKSTIDYFKPIYLWYACDDRTIYVLMLDKPCTDTTVYSIATAYETPSTGRSLPGLPPGSILSLKLPWDSYKIGMAKNEECFAGAGICLPSAMKAAFTRTVPSDALRDCPMPP